MFRPFSPENQMQTFFGLSFVGFFGGITLKPFVENLVSTIL